MKFTDSIDENCEVLSELLGGIPQPARVRAKAACVRIERAFNSLQQENPKDPATALGAAFAVLMLAQRITKMEKGEQTEGQNLIQLLQ